MTIRMGLFSLSEKAREEATALFLWVIAGAPLRCRDGALDLRHMLAASGPGCFAARLTRYCSAHCWTLLRVKNTTGSILTDILGIVFTSVIELLRSSQLTVRVKPIVDHEESVKSA